MNNAKTGLTPIDKPIYGYRKALYLCLISRSLYVDVGKRWKGLGLLYLLLSIAVFSIPLSIKLIKQFENQFKQQIVYPMKQMPTLYVQNGAISIDKPIPYLVKNKNGEVVLVVDPSGKDKDYFKTYEYLTILVSKNAISFRVPTPNLNDPNAPPDPKSKPIVQELEPTMNVVFDGTGFVDDPSVKRMQYTSMMLIYPIVISVVASIFAVIYLVVAMLAQLFASVFFTMQISYAQAIRLIIVSGTPMMMVLLLFLSTGYKFKFLGVVLILLLVFYYAFALQALRSEYRRMARQ